MDRPENNSKIKAAQLNKYGSMSVKLYFGLEHHIKHIQLFDRWQVLDFPTSKINY